MSTVIPLIQNKQRLEAVLLQLDDISGKLYVLKCALQDIHETLDKAHTIIYDIQREDYHK